MQAKSYALYLREQWLQFHIKTPAQRVTMPIQDCKHFFDLCDQSELEDSAKMAELYLHNMALIDC